jgi:spore maturation protein CgeB
LKITVFGLTLSSAWGNGHATPYRAILRALHSLGHDLAFYEKDVDYYSRWRDFLSCDYCKLVLYSNWDQIRRWALAEAAVSDVVITGSFLPDGARINDEILALARPLRVFYDLDTPVTLAALQQQESNPAPPVEYLRRDQMPAFDLYISFTGGRILDELEERWGVRRARALYGCVDPDVHTRAEPQPEFCCDLSYMGTYSPDRQHKLEALFLEPARRFASRQFVLAGSLYPAPQNWPANVRRFDHVAPGGHPALYSSSRMTLNITRAGMAARGGYCPSGRLFEAAACGTPLLTDWFEGLDKFFAPGEELLVVGHTDDVCAALRRPDNELARMAGRARQRTLQEHTGLARARQLQDLFQEARRAQPLVSGRAEMVF